MQNYYFQALENKQYRIVIRERMETNEVNFMITATFFLEAFFFVFNFKLGKRIKARHGGPTELMGQRLSLEHMRQLDSPGRGLTMRKLPEKQLQKPA